MYLVQVNDEDGLLMNLVHIGFNLELAQDFLLGVCERFTLKEISTEERDTILEDGFHLYNNGAVVLIDTSNLLSDQKLVQLFLDKCEGVR